MFKASIALVLLAFGALAYGWIAGNDTVLYGSIGASALAGLALVASQRSDHKAPATAEPKSEKAEKPARKGKAAEPATSKGSERKSRRLPSDEITRQLDLDEDDDDLSSLPQPAVRPISSPPARKRQVKIPEAAAWATEDDFADEAAETDYETAEASFEAGFQEEAYPDEAPEAAASYRQGAAAADDFRSRLAAVLGQPGLPADDDFEPEPEPKPAVLKPARTRRAAASPPVEEPKPPVRRGRKKAEPVIQQDDDLFEEEPPPPPEEAEPDWIRLEDVPRIARATQPGGGFARPDPPAGPTPYRPKRPAVGKPAAAAADAAPATRRRTTAAAKGTAAKAATPKTAVPKPRAAKPAVTRVSNAEDEAPKPRRGRPPKPKP